MTPTGTRTLPASQAMTREEAATFRRNHDTEALRLSRMSKADLARRERRILADRGIERAYGGPASKDEFISSVLELSGYGVARMNLAVHVLFHDVTWPDCPHCAGRVS